ncbi:MAG: hypothetical protein RIT81_32490 [Deltaproteobacteria bacterium]
MIALLALLAVAQPEGAKKYDPIAAMERAVEAYQAGRFREAGDQFVDIFENTKVAAQLRNAAKAYQDGELFDAAILTWRRYRALDGLKASEVAEAEARIRYIEERRAAAEARAEAEEAKARADAAERAKKEAKARADAAEREKNEAEAARLAAEQRAKLAPPPPPPIEIVTTPPPPARPYGAYVTTGVGAVALVVAGALYLHADSRLGTLDDQLSTRNASGRIVGIDRQDAQAELDGINTERNISAAAAGVGAVALAVGVVWWVLADEAPEPGQTVALRF